jgi:RNA polymerase sigma-70 factor (ECF subfamily)
MVAETPPTDKQLTEARNVGVKMALSRGLSITEADEVAQATSIALWSTWAQYDPDRGPVKTWIGAIAWRKVQDELRGRYRDSKVAEECRKDQADEDESPDIDHSCLTPAESTLMTAYIEGFTFREIGDLFGVSGDVIRKRIAALKNKLR